MTKTTSNETNFVCCSSNCSRKRCCRRRRRYYGDIIREFGNTINTYSQLNRYEFGYRLNCCNSKVERILYRGCQPFIIYRNAKHRAVAAAAAPPPRAAPLRTAMMVKKTQRKPKQTKYNCEIRSVYVCCLVHIYIRIGACAAGACDNPQTQISA